jgi:transposase
MLTHLMPPNVAIIPLPPKSPELNPVENDWQFMRDNRLSNRVFKSYGRSRPSNQLGNTQLKRLCRGGRSRDRNQDGNHLFQAGGTSVGDRA